MLGGGGGGRRVCEVGMTRFRVFLIAISAAFKRGGESTF